MRSLCPEQYLVLMSTESTKHLRIGINYILNASNESWLVHLY